MSEGIYDFLDGIGEEYLSWVAIDTHGVTKNYFIDNYEEICEMVIEDLRSIQGTSRQKKRIMEDLGILTHRLSIYSGTFTNKHRTIQRMKSPESTLAMGVEAGLIIVERNKPLRVSVTDKGRLYGYLFNIFSRLGQPLKNYQSRTLYRVGLNEHYMNLDLAEKELLLKAFNVQLTRDFYRNTTQRIEYIKNPDEFTQNSIIEFLDLSFGDIKNKKCFFYLNRDKTNIKSRHEIGKKIFRILKNIEDSPYVLVPLSNPRRKNNFTKNYYHYGVEYNNSSLMVKIPYYYIQHFKHKFPNKEIKVITNNKGLHEDWNEYIESDGYQQKPDYAMDRYEPLTPAEKTTSFFLKTHFVLVDEDNNPLGICQGVVYKLKSLHKGHGDTDILWSYVIHELMRFQKS